MSSAKSSSFALFVYTQYIRMSLRHPGWMRSCTCGEAYKYAGTGKAVHLLIQPGEVILLFTWLIERPREYIKGSYVDSSQLEHPFVFTPDFGFPLLRIIVTAVPNFWQFRIKHAHLHPLMIS
ncbi:hypothetical protein D3C85_1133590 [compost metagenome]